jgi:hypothetical protein
MFALRFIGKAIVFISEAIVVLALVIIGPIGWIVLILWGISEDNEKRDAALRKELEVLKFQLAMQGATKAKEDKK